MSNDPIQPRDGISTSEEMDEWVLEIGARPNLDISSHAMDSNIEKHPSIFGKWQCWDDFGIPVLTKTQKWLLVVCTTHCFGLDIRSYLEYMQGKVDLAWSYYHGVDEQFRTAENNKHFIEYLLVHSCFLIFSMILLSGEKELKDSWFEIMNKKHYLSNGVTFNEVETMINFITQDPHYTQSYMLTMNYQIPWFIVDVVYTEISNLSKLFVTPIHKIAVIFSRPFFPNSLNKIDGGDAVPEGGFKHLLHIFHWSGAPNGKYLFDTSRSNNWIAQFHIPSATELQLSQTVFIKDVGASIDVSYGDGRISGVMQLTRWHLLHYNTKIYESLLRFENQYLSERPFTAYVACMACLLKTEVDVRVLRANDIIPNTRFDDKDVLCCVQEFKSFITGNSNMPNELVILEKKVMAHHKKSSYRVYGEFKKRYCSNPWITMSVIAAILLFVLTFIQTVLSFIQTKYSVLSYKKQ